MAAGVRCRTTVLLVVLAAVTSCTGTVDGRSAGESVAATPPGASREPPPPPAAEGACPAERPRPDPDRPRVELVFELAADGRSVSGRERVRFTPDLPTDELVFRLTANQPYSVQGGAGIEVAEVTGDDVADVSFENASAAPGTQGGLLVVELADTLQPGESTEVDIAFELALGGDGFDRFGTDGDLSWWGSGHPLLAWVPGEGWSRTPMLDNPGETAVSPVADTSIRVVAPADATVTMTGGAERAGTASGRTEWRARDRAARDVAVVVGPATQARGTAGPVDVRVTAPTGTEAEALLARVEAAIDALVELLGPFPFERMSLARLPDAGGGVEYPGMILLADDSDLVLVHELAHMWFYGMVGGDQGVEPWLDESFATYAEAVVDGPADNLGGALQLPLEVGLPVADYPSVDAYFDTVYGKGAAMLLAARQAAGADAFDDALRCYVEAVAWQIATPQDVTEAFADLPAALAVLEQAGALAG